MAMDRFVWGFWPAFYLAGVLASVYHLANGLWTAGITWGFWISPTAQQRATKVCVAFGVVLAVIGTSAWWAAVRPGPEDIAKARIIEDKMYDAALATGLVYDMPEKRAGGHDAAKMKSDEAKSESKTEESLIFEVNH